MKKISTIIVRSTLFLLFLFLSCSFFARSKNTQLNTINVYLNGSKIKISTILDKQGALYVPVNEICYYFMCDYKKDDDRRIINFTRYHVLKAKPESIDSKKSRKKRAISINSSNYQIMIDGIYLFITPVVYDNIFYISLEHLAESFEKSMKWGLFKNSVKVKDYPEEYAGSVNGEKIKKRFFDERYLQKYRRLTSEDGEEGNQEKKKLSREQEMKLKEEVFNEIVELVIASQKAREYGMVVNDDIKKGINYYLGMTVNRFGGIEGFKKTFGKDGITYQDAVNYFTYGVIKEELMEKIAEGVEPSEEMMRAYYDNGKESFIKPAKAIVEHILIPIKDKAENSFSDEKVKEQKKVADMILEKIREGEDFEALRQKYSEDYYPDTNMKNHPNGFVVEQGSLSIAKVFEDAVFKLKPGEISDVVYTYRGYHIIKLISRTEEKQKAFGESKERIKKDLAYTAKVSYLDEMMQKWKEESEIEKKM